MHSIASQLMILLGRSMPHISSRASRNVLLGEPRTTWCGTTQKLRLLVNFQMMCVHSKLFIHRKVDIRLELPPPSELLTQRSLFQASNSPVVWLASIWRDDSTSCDFCNTPDVMLSGFLSPIKYASFVHCLTSGGLLGAGNLPVTNTCSTDSGPQSAMTTTICPSFRFWVLPYSSRRCFSGTRAISSSSRVSMASWGVLCVVIIRPLTACYLTGRPLSHPCRVSL